MFGDSRRKEERDKKENIVVFLKER